MRVGIVTYHSNHNHGAILQAMALRHVLTKLGHEPYFVRYDNPRHKRQTWLDSWRNRYKRIVSTNLFSLIGYVFHTLPHIHVKKKIADCMNRYIQKNITPYLDREGMSFDVLILGSDQIWRKQVGNIGYDPFYFGHSPIQAKRKISYAASMGQVPQAGKDADCLKKLLSGVNRISVREHSLESLLNDLGYSDVKTVLDPTLLLTSEEWKRLVPPTAAHTGRRYALFYEVELEAFQKQRLQEHAASMGLELLTLHLQAISKETPYDRCLAAPDDFLSLVMDADFIYTSSYHGMIFSIMFHKPFLASFPDMIQRAESLLEDLGLESRLLKKGACLPEAGPSINYQEVDERLQALRTESLEFLMNALDEP